MIKKIALLNLLIGTMVLIGACSQGESNVDSGNREQILHIGNGTEPQGLDPHVVTGVPEHHIISALYEGLVLKNPETLEIEPAIAKSWEISDDGKTYTFYLRDNAQWSNGDPITAEDIRWSWWRAMQPALGNQYVFMYNAIKNAEKYVKQEITDFADVGVTVIDDYTLQVELENPTAYFLQLLDHYAMFPVHRATIEKFGAPDESYTRWTRPENIVTNGPFVLESWQLNKKLTVVRNEGYWDNDRVTLNGIVFHPIDVVTTEERMFRAGQLHYTSSTLIERIPFYRENYPEYLSIAPYNGTYFYRFNTDKENFSDVRIRKAMAMTIDRDQLIRTILNDIVTPAYAITPPGVLGYQPPKTFDYNPDEARRLLAEAGFPNGEGLPELELQFNTSEQHRKIAIAIQQMWKNELGVNVRLQNKDWKVYLDDTSIGNYEISRAGWIGDYVDPNTFLDMWLSGSELNQTGWGSERYDQLIARDAPATKTREERFAIYQEAETIMMEAMPFIPIYTYSSNHFKHPAIQGLDSNVMNYYNYRYVSLDSDWDGRRIGSTN